MKSPKVYFRDTGLLHTLLGIRTEQELLQHPRSGASWEGFVLTPSMRAVIQDLELSRIVVIYPGSKPYPLAENIQVVPLASLAGDWTRILE